MSGQRGWMQAGLLSGAVSLLLSPTSARAGEDCWNSDRTFYDCSAHSGSGGGVGVSAPVLGDTLDSNPANLPSIPTPFGLEVMMSHRTAPREKAGVGFSTVKGFDGLGFGIGSWSKGTFSAPDFDHHFLGKKTEEYRAFELKSKSVLGLRLGATVVLPTFFIPKFIRFSLGGSIGFGQVKGDASPQVGLVMRVFGFGVGYSQNYERLSRDLPRTRLSVFSSGVFLGPVFVGYSYSVMRSWANRTFTNTAGIRIPFGRWVSHGDVKFQKDHRGAQDDWYRAGLLRRFGKRIGIGYEYGYYRYSHSLLFQLYL